MIVPPLSQFITVSDPLLIAGHTEEATILSFWGDSIELLPATTLSFLKMK